MPTCTASKISFVSLTQPSGDPGSRLALSTFWVSCNWDSGIILSQEQLIIGTLVLWKSCLTLVSLTVIKSHTNSLCSLSLHAFRAYAFISTDKLIIGDTCCRYRYLDSVLETRLQRWGMLWSPSTHFSSKFLRLDATYPRKLWSRGRGWTFGNTKSLLLWTLDKQ